MSLRSDFRLSFQLPHLRLRLVQPEAHVHFAVHRRCALYHRFEKVPTLVRTGGKRVRISETSKDCPGLEIPFTDEDPCPLQRIDGSLEITLSEAHATDARQSLGKSERMVSAFRNPECLPSMRARINQSSQTREGEGQPAV